MLEGVMIPLSKPYMRLFHTTKGNRWVPRVRMESQGDYNYLGALATDGSPRPDNTYLPNDTALRSFLSLLTGNAVSDTNGILPMMLDTQLVTRLLGLLTSVGSSTMAADRAKLFRGLEQIVTSIQTSMGAGSYPAASYLSYSRYGWMFPPLRDGSAGSPISLNLDTALDDLVGGDSINKGLATFVDRRIAEHPTGWATADDNYARAFGMMGTLMGDTASPYYVTNDVINIIDGFLTSTTATPTDLKALRHTLGVLFARYNGTAWGTDTRLRDLLTVHLPDVLSIVPVDGAPDHAENLLRVVRSLLDWDGDYDTVGYEATDPDVMDFMMTDVLDLGETPQEIIVSLFNLLNKPEMYDPNYTSADYPRRPAIQTIADVLRDLALEI
jgi:hypothetical protein